MLCCFTQWHSSNIQNTLVRSTVPWSLRSPLETRRPRTLYPFTYQMLAEQASWTAGRHWVMWMHLRLLVDGALLLVCTTVCTECGWETHLLWQTINACTPADQKLGSRMWLNINNHIGGMRRMFGKGCWCWIDGTVKFSEVYKNHIKWHITIYFFIARY